MIVFVWDIWEAGAYLLKPDYDYRKNNLHMVDICSLWARLGPHRFQKKTAKLD
jgi:hypothetical protein